MSNYRLFIAVQLSPENIAKLFDYQQRKLNRLPFRLVPTKSLHLTLIFIGNAESAVIGQINKICQKVAKEIKPMIVKLERIKYAPRFSSPRLVWIEGDVISEILELKEKLEESLIQETNVNYLPEKRLFKPHITLARLKKFDSMNLPPVGEIEEKMSIQMKVDTFSLMESRLTKEGAEYITLAQFPLLGK